MIYLHIGRHKTGTSALQRFLIANRNRLGRAGLIYPKPLSGRAAHHDLAVGLNPARMAEADPETRERALEEVARAVAWVKASEPRIVSSEAFQNLDPRTVGKLFRKGETSVLVYLREPLDYLISSYAQMIQAQPVRIGFKDYAARFNPDYARFLDRWGGVFGDEHLNARVYDRARFPEQDVRRDFLAALNLDAADFKLADEPSNPSIGPELIEFKGVLNAVIPPQEQRRLRLYNHLGRLAPLFSRRMTVTPQMQRDFRGRFAEANDRAFARHASLQGAGFPTKDFSGDLISIDRQAVIARALAALSESHPVVAQRIEARIATTPLSDIPPLLGD